MNSRMTMLNLWKHMRNSIYIITSTTVTSMTLEDCKQMMMIVRLRKAITLSKEVLAFPAKQILIKSHVIQLSIQIKMIQILSHRRIKSLIPLINKFLPHERRGNRQILIAQIPQNLAFQLIDNNQFQIKIHIDHLFIRLEQPPKNSKENTKDYNHQRIKEDLDLDVVL